MAEPITVFLSHTKLDGGFCDRFDNICANVGMQRFRSEFALIEKPSWQTIKAQLGKSKALFFLVGKELVRQQERADKPGWKFTQNWISYEVGIAHQLNIDVWVICDSVQINFPVPYFNNYLPHGLEPPQSMDYMNAILWYYSQGKSFPISNAPDSITISCPSCFIKFNLHATVEPGDVIICPQCLGDIRFGKHYQVEIF